MEKMMMMVEVKKKERTKGEKKKEEEGEKKNGDFFLNLRERWANEKNKITRLTVWFGLG